MFLLLLPLLSSPCPLPLISPFTLGPVLIHPSLHLRCHCSNCHYSKIAWYRGQSLTSSPYIRQNEDGSLQFYRSSPELAGFYRCVVSTPCGSSSIPPIEVIYPNLSSSSAIVTKWEGDTFQVICNKTMDVNLRYSVESFNGKNGINVSGRFVIPSLSISDSGFYRCRATLGSFFEYTETVGLIVKRKSNTEDRHPFVVFPPAGHVFRVLRGEDIKCAFGGRPTPSVLYYNLSGTRVEPRDMEDNQGYVCIGTNLNVFSSSRQFRVVIDKKPSGVISNYRMTVEDGRAYQFRLSVSGKPSPSISWFVGHLMTPALTGTNISLSSDSLAITVAFSATTGPRLLSFVLRNSHGTFFRSYSFSITSPILSKTGVTHNTVFIVTFSLIGVLLICVLVATIFRLKRKKRTFQHQRDPGSTRVKLKTERIPDMFDLIKSRGQH